MKWTAIYIIIMVGHHLEMVALNLTKVTSWYGQFYDLAATDILCLEWWGFRSWLTKFSGEIYITLLLKMKKKNQFSIKYRYTSLSMDRRIMVKNNNHLNITVYKICIVQPILLCLSDKKKWWIYYTVHPLNCFLSLLVYFRYIFSF